MWTTLWLVVSSFFVVRGYQCNQDKEKMKIIERMLVKDNPTHLIADVQFSDVWASNFLTDSCECSNVLYTKKADGSMEDKTVCRLKTGENKDVITEVLKETDKPGVYIMNGDYGTSENKDVITEVLKETDKPGVYIMNGDYGTSKTQLKSLSHIIYADSTTIAFFVCEVVGTNWFVGVQVRSEVRDRLSSKVGDNEVKQSLAKAQNKMLDAKNIFTLPPGRDFLMYDTNKLC